MKIYDTDLINPRVDSVDENQVPIENTGAFAITEDFFSREIAGSSWYQTVETAMLTPGVVLILNRISEFVGENEPFTRNDIEIDETLIITALALGINLIWLATVGVLGNYYNLKLKEHAADRATIDQALEQNYSELMLLLSSSNSYIGSEKVLAEAKVHNILLLLPSQVSSLTLNGIQSQRTADNPPGEHWTERQFTQYLQNRSRKN